MRISDKVSRLLTPEFRLLAACAWLDEVNWPAQHDLVLELLGSVTHPEEFLSLVRRHRLPVLAHTVLVRATREAGIEVAWIQRLRSHARQTRIRNLRLHSEWQRIEKLSLEAQIRLRTLKGPGLSTRLYGDVGMRHTRDLDLLVRPDDVDRLLDVLETAGYDVDRGFAPHRRGSLAFRISRSLEYHTACRSSDGLMVEVHSHLERALDSSMSESWTELAWSLEPRTQAYFDLLYCTLHGSQHGWSRLKWLGDLRVMASRITEEEWPDLLRHAEKLRLQILLAETLLLLHWITGLALPERVMPFLRTVSEPSRRMANQASEWMRMPEQNLNSTTLPDRIRRCHLGWRVGQRLPIRERATYWLSQALFSSTDMRALELPTCLTGLYPIIRPLSFLGRSIFASASKLR